MGLPIRFILSILLICSASFIHAQKVSFQMHSHNDYEQEFPLTTALSNNFKSIEVDIFEFDDKIIVSHDDDDLHLKPTLKELYLEPLSQFSFGIDQSIFLLIDLKMEGTKILNVLHQLLETYESMFKSRNHLSQNAPVQIILSGSVDKEYVISSDSFPFFFIDGRVEDLELNYDSDIMPLISADIEDLYCWKPDKAIKKSKLEPILKAINKTHEQEKMIRFWNTAEVPELWNLLIAMKVDIIGVDDIEKFVEYSNLLRF